ncbi:MAG: YeeE/YedE family protein [Nitrospirae bacterium]|nr:YeeE/YedE family protein [Nitrospirota bacterium]
MNIKKIFTKPWSFVWGGFLVGLAQVIYFLKYQTPIPVTTGLAKMFGSIEENITKTDYITRLYDADIHWIIIGTLAGAFLVTLLEGERKAWAKYPPRVALLAFIGGATFGLGTRIAQGCTTWHYLGGIPAMSLTSIDVAIVSIPFAFIAFMLMTKLNVAGYLKHHEHHATVKHCVELEYPSEILCYDPKHQPHKDPLRIILTVFLFLLLASTFWTAFKGESSNSIGRLPWSEIFLKTLVGFLLGFGIAKSGFGTECAVMAPKSLLMKQSHFDSMKVAKITQTMFTGLMPFTALLIAILMFNITILITWIFFGWDVPVVVEAGRYKYGFHLGHLVGGPLLGIGAVLMIGCEIRTYARTAMGYLTGLASLPGFFFGYLPFTLYREKFEEIFFSRGIIEEKNILELLPQNSYIQYGFALAYTAVLVAILVWSIKKGSQMVKVTPKEYLTKSTDEIFLKGLKEETITDIKSWKGVLEIEKEGRKK